MKIHQDNAGHMTNMAAMLIYGKNTLKIFFPGTTGLILMKLWSSGYSYIDLTNFKHKYTNMAVAPQ